MTEPASEGLDVQPSETAAMALPATQLDVAASASPIQAVANTRLPGPGIPEAMLWWIGVPFAQFAGVVLALTIVVLGVVATCTELDPKMLIGYLSDMPFVAEFIEKHQVTMVAAGQMFFVLLAMVAVRLRLGRSMRQQLGLIPLRLSHVALITLAILPVQMLSMALYHYVDRNVWEPLMAQLPQLQQVDALNTMDALGGFFKQMSIPLLVMAIAVSPAIAEELLFRGLIGRGLIARWGLPVGIVLTSLLFAAFHMHPVHAAGVALIGVTMHFAYVATRSFFAPVLIHFLNNSLAVATGKIAASADTLSTHGTKSFVAEAATNGSAELAISGELLIASACFLIVAGYVMWQTRVRYVLADGSIWSPGYATVEEPPEAVAATRVQPRIGTQLGVALMGATFLFAICFLRAMPPL